MPKTLFLSPVMGKERVSHCAKGVPPGKAQAHAFHYKDQTIRYLTSTVPQLKKKKTLLPAAGFILFSWTECGTFHKLSTGGWEGSPRTGEAAESSGCWNGNQGGHHLSPSQQAWLCWLEDERGCPRLFPKNPDRFTATDVKRCLSEKEQKGLRWQSNG